MFSEIMDIVKPQDVDSAPSVATPLVSGLLIIAPHNRYGVPAAIRATEGGVDSAQTSIQ